jgi:flagellar motility protein MotE (MotC chaperone)
MKFVLKIFLGLMLVVLNLAGYLFLFSYASGMKPSQAGKYLAVKIEQLKTGKKLLSPEQEKAIKEKQEFEESRKMLEVEKEELKQQKAQLLKEKEELETIKKQIDSLRAIQAKADEDKMYNLAKIFDEMDKQQAAKVFAQMEDSLVISILPKMKSANASLILQYMEPTRSAQITKLFLSGI